MSTRNAGGLPGLATAAVVAVGVAAGTATVARQAAAQEMALDSLFRAHRTPLEMVDGQLRGPGFDRIVQEAADAQFVMIGESHNLKDIPLFTAHLFETLAERHGYGHLVLENGSYAMEQYNAPAVRDEVDAAFELANRYPNALQFRTDQEIEMIARAGSASPASYDPVWGVDNAWGVLHLLEALVAEAPGAEARTTAEGLAERARRHEAHRPSDDHPRFITDVLREADLARLEAAYRDAGRAAARLLDVLRTGFEIYAARTSRPAIYRANDRRERLMRSQFMEHYRAAEAAGEEPPKAVLKFGQWHALSGMLNWGDVVPFGTLVREFARSRGSDMLSIWTGLVNEPGHVWTLMDFPDYVPLGSAGSIDRWWVVDLREIRPYAASGAVELNDELRKVVFGFDLALLIGSGDRATGERLEGN